MRCARLPLLLLAVCLAVNGGCRRKKTAAPLAATQFSPEAVLAVTEAEKSPQASLALLNETLKDWLLRQPQLPKDANEFVTARLLPRLPTPPPGKRFVLDPKQRGFVLADQ